MDHNQNNVHRFPFEEHELITTAEAAVLLRKAVGTLRYWRHIKYGPRSFRVGRRVMYFRSEVLAWLYEQAAA